MHLNGGVMLRMEGEQSVLFVKAGGQGVHHAHLRVIQAFGQGQKQGQLINQLPIIFREHFLIEA